MELFCLPHGLKPSKGSFNHRNIHKMYTQIVHGEKKLFKAVRNIDLELPARPSRNVITTFVNLLHKNNVFKLLYHGEDHLSLYTWFSG